MIDRAKLYLRLGEYLGQQPSESLREAALAAVRTTGTRQQRRLAAHAVLDIDMAIGDIAWAGIKRAIRIYESCGGQT